MLDVKNYNLRKISETEAKDTIKEASLSSYHLFAREYNEEIKDISGPDLFNKYCDFVDKNKFKTCSRTFISNIRKFTGEAKPKRIDGRVQKVYSLLPEYFDKFKKYNDDLEKAIVDEDVPDEAI